VCILEAMKMENQVLATRDGLVAQVSVQPGQIVDANQLLAIIEDAAGG
jgi:biotin carboxyl carrier protein